MSFFKDYPLSYSMDPYVILPITCKSSDDLGATIGRLLHVLHKTGLNDGSVVGYVCSH